MDACPGARCSHCTTSIACFSRVCWRWDCCWQTASGIRSCSRSSTPHPCRNGGRSRSECSGSGRAPLDRPHRAHDRRRVHAAILVGKHARRISVRVLFPSSFYGTRALADDPLSCRLVEWLLGWFWALCSLFTSAGGLLTPVALLVPPVIRLLRIGGGGERRD